MRAKEELRLVESFSELRAGMVCVSKNCSRCGNDHRFILTTQWKHCWNFEPPTSCEHKWGDPNERAHLSPVAVDKRKLYRVIDPALENEQAHSTSKKTNQPARVR